MNKRRRLTRPFTFLKLMMILVALVLTGNLHPTWTMGGEYLFISRITVDGTTTYQSGVNDIRKWEDLFDNASLKEIFPGYVPTSSVDALVSLRGLEARLTYDVNETSLRFRVPVLGIDISFDGSSRAEARDRLVEWLESGEAANLPTANDLIRKLLHGVIRYSPVDPVAGNPNSMQTSMLRADYERLMEGPFLKLENLPPDTPAPSNQFHFRTEFNGTFQAGPYDVNGLTIDFGGTINLDNRRWAVLLDLPMGVTYTEGAESLLVYPGAGLKYRMNENWDLFLMGRAGVTGSVKVGALAVLASGNVGSYARFPLAENLTLGWAILGGVNTSIDDIEIDTYNLSYDLQNYPIRTGLDLSGRLPWRVFKMPTRWGVYGTYTHFFGTELYLIDMGEVGVQFALVSDRGDMWYDRVRVDAGYVVGENYDGASIRLTLSF